MTIKELKEIIFDIPDDFTFEVAVLEEDKPFHFLRQTRELKKQHIDVGYSDKIVKLFIRVSVKPTGL